MVSGREGLRDGIHGKGIGLIQSTFLRHGDDDLYGLRLPGRVQLQQLSLNLPYAHGSLPSGPRDLGSQLYAGVQLSIRKLRLSLRLCARSLGERRYA